MTNAININLELIINCPHCNESIIIEQLNCKIFRHAVIKSNNQQINPHSTKKECEYLITNNLIYGCGKPFQIIDNKPVICDYI
jgi:hypothetical protein